jgi:methanogenic corrinoid protein MtbC1
LWLTHNITPAQEHFISVLIRQKIIVAIDALPLVPKSKTGVLLFLPEEELHEIGLLFYHYIVKKEGFKTYYLGQMVPSKDLSFIYDIYKPRILITSITSFPAVMPFKAT